MRKVSIALILAMVLTMFALPVNAAGPPVYEDLESLAIAMRNAMRERQEEITFIVSEDIDLGDSSWLDTDPHMTYSPASRIEHCAFRLATSQQLAETPFDGDYLEDQFWYFATADTPYRNTMPNTIAIHAKMMYRTTQEQQREVEEKFAEINASLNLDGKTDYQKVQAIEQWIRKNVAYDYGTTPSNLRHTAWQGLIEGSCVCEGKAQILYIFCQANGIPCRTVESSPLRYDSAGHEFNIVKLGTKWYFVDPTNDHTSVAITAMDEDEPLYRSFRGLNSASRYERNLKNTYRIEDCIIDEYGYVPTLSEEIFVTHVYDDVMDWDWFEYPVRFTTVHGLFQGCGDGCFHPNDNITIGQLATVLHRLSKDSGAEDQTTRLWYEQGMNWALTNGIITTTDPSASASREDTVSALYQMFLTPDSEQSLSAANHTYTDQNNIHNNAAADWAYQNGYMVGYPDGSFQPGNTLTRAEFAAVLQRIIQQ